MNNLITFNPFFIKPVSHTDIKYNYIDQPWFDQYLQMLENYHTFCGMYIHGMRVFYKTFCNFN